MLLAFESIESALGNGQSPTHSHRNMEIIKPYHPHSADGTVLFCLQFAGLFVHFKANFIRCVSFFLALPLSQINFDRDFTVFQLVPQKVHQVF